MIDEFNKTLMIKALENRSKNTIITFPAKYSLGNKTSSDKVKQMAKRKQQPEGITNNLVAKHMHEFNTSHVFVDRKKESKRGYTKHKKGRYSDDYRPFSLCMI